MDKSCPTISPGFEIITDESEPFDDPSGALWLLRGIKVTPDMIDAGLVGFLRYASIDADDEQEAHNALVSAFLHMLLVVRQDELQV